MHPLAELPPSVRTYLSDFVMRWRRVVALRAVGSALAVLAVWALAAATADRLLHLPGLVRLASLIFATLSALAVGIRRLRPLRGPVDWVTMAGMIEQHDPRFDQALITVTSRVLGLPEHRGSDEILSHLLREVEHHAAQRSQIRILTLRSAAGPWALLAVAIVAIIALAQVAYLGGPRLLARLVMPLADLPPVTTTELHVSPEGAEVMQSEALRIEVLTRRLGNNPVLIFINDEGDNWTQYPMDDAGNGRFTYTINTVGHDFRYKMRGGDAETRPFTVRVKRPPAVAEFRIRYTLPAYTGKAPFTITNSDGTIQAPAGSDVLLTIVATEPLQSALLKVGDRKVLMDRTAEDNVRQAAFPFDKDTPPETYYELDLISAREVRGGSSKMVMRVTTDRPPVVRLQEAGQILRLNPRDILRLSYQAIDDYGVVTVSLLAQVNLDAPLQIPLHLAATRRHVEETVDFDLAGLKLKIGDVLTLSVNARDTALKEAVSDELRVLISPLSVDLDAHERINGLTSAFNFAASLVEETAAAAKAIEDAQAQRNHESPAYLSADASLSRHLTSASEAATLLKQSLLRTMAHSRRPELSVALASWLDEAQQQLQTADDLFGRGGSSDGMGRGARDGVLRANAKARELFAEVSAAAQGERALAVLFEQADLKSAQGAAAPAVSLSKPPIGTKDAETLAQVLQRASDEITARAAEIGVNLSSPQADAQLHGRVEAARRILRSKQPIDFLPPIREWSQDPRQHAALARRLATAAQAEAVRNDADLVRAKDLELAARVVSAVEAAMNQAPGKLPPGLAAAVNGLTAAMAALQREHAIGRQPTAAHGGDDLRAHNAANNLRNEMARWAETSQPKNSDAPARPGELESIAFLAGAISTRHEYKLVADEDRQLALKLDLAARKPGGRTLEGDASPAATQVVEDHRQRIQQASDAVTRQMAVAENIFKLQQHQEKLASELRAAKPALRDVSSHLHALADRVDGACRLQQESVSAATLPAQDPDDSNLRVRALAALLAAQEELTAMQQHLALAQDAESFRRKTTERANALRHEVATGVPQRLRAANRAADQADQDAREALDEFDSAMSLLTPQSASALADRLEPFDLDAPAAREIMAGLLAPTLTEFASACDSSDAQDVARAAADVRSAIDGAQKELAAAQSLIAERDPLMAAGLFARAAADSLLRHPPDVRSCMIYQANVSLALTRAWENSVHRAAEIRLSQLPSLQAVYGPPPALRDIPIAGAGPLSSGSHDWPRLHARENEDLTATLHDPDPLGYEDQLKLYFEVMNKSQEKK